MAYVLWQIGAIVWVVGAQNIPIGMMFVVLGSMFSKDANKTQKIIGIILSITTLLLAAVHLVNN